MNASDPFTDHSIKLSMLELGFEEDGGITYCPPGAALGATDLNQRGHIGEEITVWPRSKHTPLFDFQGRPRPMVYGLAATALWNQEYYVYLKERYFAVNRAIDEVSVGKGKHRMMIPRPGDVTKENGQRSYDTTIEPQAADFGADSAWWQEWIKQAKGIRKIDTTLDRNLE